MAWTKVASITDFGDREVIPVVVGARELAVFRLEDGYFATGNICTHQRAFMSDGYIEDGCVECPLHQAFFNIRTGEVVEGPAKDPLPTFALRLEGDDILLDLD